MREGDEVAASWMLTVECSAPQALASFWCAALGYVPAPPPVGFATWEAWLRTHEVPEHEWDDGAVISDPAGVAPGLTFLKVPEVKVGKNRMHLDLQVGGGRHRPVDERWPRVMAESERLMSLGARLVLEVARDDGRPDHLVLADPEGNEFCIV